MYKLGFSREARRELREITAWIREHRTRFLADQVLDEIMAAGLEIASIPQAWPISKYDDRIRTRPLRKIKYALFYEIMPDTVMIVAIAHMSREPGYWLDRRK